MRRWEDFHAGDLRIDPARSVAALPVAAIEQHGPHLPLSTDSDIAAGMLREVAAILPEDLDIRLLPLQSVGKSDEHLWAPGTLTLSAEAALAVWTEIGRSVARAGCRKLVLVNSHGGNADLLGLIARRLRIEAGMLAVKCHWMAFGWPEGLFSDREARFGIHGGDVETSLMLHFRPDLVRMDQARDFTSAAEGAALSPVGAVAKGWISKDLNPLGVVGEAHLATAEKGARTARWQAERFVALLRQVADSPLPEM